MSDKLRPTKKQTDLLIFIRQFIEEHGYSPSYREIMTGCNYSSVATVAVHVNNLIQRGHLSKRDNSARSLELAEAIETGKLKSNEIKPGQEKWLVDKVEYFFRQVEQRSATEQSKLDELYVLTGALKVMGLDGAAQSFMSRLSELKNRAQT